MASANALTSARESISAGAGRRSGAPHHAQAGCTWGKLTGARGRCSGTPHSSGAGNTQSAQMRERAPPNLHRSPVSPVVARRCTTGTRGAASISAPRPRRDPADSHPRRAGLHAEPLRSVPRCAALRGAREGAHRAWLRRSIRAPGWAAWSWRARPAPPAAGWRLRLGPPPRVLMRAWAARQSRPRRPAWAGRAWRDARGTGRDPGRACLRARAAVCSGCTQCAPRART
jgi:hypothetical protein